MTNVFLAKQYLSVQVVHVDHIFIYKINFAHTKSTQLKCYICSETSCT